MERGLTGPEANESSLCSCTESVAGGPTFGMEDGVRLEGCDALTIEEWEEGLSPSSNSDSYWSAQSSS